MCAWDGRKFRMQGFVSDNPVFVNYAVYGNTYVTFLPLGIGTEIFLHLNKTDRQKGPSEAAPPSAHLIPLVGYFRTIEVD